MVAEAVAIYSERPHLTVKCKRPMLIHAACDAIHQTAKGCT